MKNSLRKQEITCLLLTLLVVEIVQTVMELNIPTALSLKTSSTSLQYPPFHLSFLLAQTARNARANIVLDTQALTKIVIWLLLRTIRVVAGGSPFGEFRTNFTVGGFCER